MGVHILLPRISYIFFFSHLTFPVPALEEPRWPSDRLPRSWLERRGSGEGPGHWEEEQPRLQGQELPGSPGWVTGSFAPLNPR